MTVKQAIARAFLHAQRKPIPPTGNKYLALLQIADSMQKLWAAEPNIEWSSLYDYVNTGTVSTTDLYDLDDSIKSISRRQGDAVRVVKNGQTTEYVVVDPNQLFSYRYTNAVCRIGTSLRFSKAFDSTSPLLGGTILVPALLNVDDIVSDTQDVQVDDPMWLVYMMAAEFIRTDVTRQDQYDTLINLAAQHMERMKSSNAGQVEDINIQFVASGMDWN